MSGQVHANPEDLKRLQKDVSTCVEEIGQALKKLQRSLDRADWHDQARISFEAKMKEATSNASRTADGLKDLQPILTKKVAELQQFLRG